MTFKKFGVGVVKRQYPSSNTQGPRCYINYPPDAHRLQTWFRGYFFWSGQYILCKLTDWDPFFHTPWTLFLALPLIPFFKLCLVIKFFYTVFWRSLNMFTTNRIHDEIFCIASVFVYREKFWGFSNDFVDYNLIACNKINLFYQDKLVLRLAGDIQNSSCLVGDIVSKKLSRYIKPIRVQ